ncbi:MAG: isoprenylcysteine carboxylmethyltransferase family protein [Candidatus Marinimicrobia bacterium]|nr:isoprenylcysteine carboxylmethyltransferase family protein [Candidatus Neomarinimicrobiota bacterium]MCF7828658.1 isoprenylcysteine carboxylmethyltransferase family protein [Candidatus Neomarinimicrobiota bacterium]MCF7880399.1 isoprenylcysteine carboxylmethyltransferase family protein [Candidatus Neomarinimicrobiota bacterium]
MKHSHIYVFFQFLFIGIILLQGPVLADGFILLLLEAGGILLGLWSIWVMGIGNFNITPETVKGGQMVARGPYRLIRHPMYTSVLLTLLPLVLSKLTIFRILWYVLLLVTLCLKCRYEENLLEDHYSGYTEYRNRTWRIIPFLY